MPQEEVATVFKISDLSSGPLRQMTEAGERLQVQTEKTRKAVEGVGRRLPAGHAEVSPEERERFKQDRDEMRVRRSRTRGLRLEEQRSNVLERATEVASRSVIGVQKDLVGGLRMAGSTAEQIGYSMGAFGGTLGKIGESLVKIGGPIAAGIAAFEIGNTILESFGVDLKETGAQVVNWAAHLAGVQQTGRDMEEAEALDAKYLGYKSLADYKAGKAAIRSAELHEATTSLLQRNLQAFERAGNKLPETEVELAELADRMARSISGPGTAVAYDDALKAAREQISSSTLAVTHHAEQEIKLADAQRRANAKLDALPWDATKEQQLAHVEAVHKTVMAMAQHREIELADAAALEQSLIAHSSEAGSIESIIAQRQAAEDAEAKVTFYAEQYAKLLPHIPVHQTIESMQKFNQAFAEISTQAVQALGLDTPSKLQHFQEQLMSRVKHTRHYDFRNSRFDIKQAFAEGFDPDRIAVGFTNDLAALGEQKIQNASILPGTVR